MKRLLALFLLFAFTTCLFTGCNVGRMFDGTKPYSYQEWSSEYAASILEHLFGCPTYGTKTCLKNNESKLVFVDWATGEYSITDSKFPAIDSTLVMDAANVYFKSDYSDIVAVSVNTGDISWKHDYSDVDDQLDSPSIFPPILYKDWVLFTTRIGFPKSTFACIVALDKKTGKTAWRYQSKCSINSPLVIIGDYLYFWYTKDALIKSPKYSIIYELDLHTQQVTNSFKTSALYWNIEKVVGDYFYVSTWYFQGIQKIIPKEQKNCHFISYPSYINEIKYADKDMLIYGNGNTVLTGHTTGPWFFRMNQLWTFENPYQAENKEERLEKSRAVPINKNEIAIASEKRLFIFNAMTKKCKEVREVDVFPYVTNSKLFSSILKDLCPKGVKDFPEFVQVPFEQDKRDYAPGPDIKPPYPSLSTSWKIPLQPEKSKKPCYTQFGLIAYVVQNATIQAVNVKSGDILWEYNSDALIKTKPQVDGKSLYYIDADKNVCSLDLQTRQITWKHPLAESEQCVKIWDSNALYGKWLLLNIRSAWDISKSEISFQKSLRPEAYVVALDTATGKEAWRFHVDDWFIDSMLYVHGHKLYFSNFKKLTAEYSDDFRGAGQLGGRIFQIDLPTQKSSFIDTSTFYAGSYDRYMMNQLWFDVEPYFYSSYRNGDAYRLHQETMKLEKIYEGNQEGEESERPDWQILEYANDSVFIRGNGPLNAIDTETLELQWQCNLPNGLKTFVNVVPISERTILVIDELDQFHFIDVETGTILQSYSFPFSVVRAQIVELHENILLLEIQHNQETYLAAIDLAEHIQ